jgi:hypothetical protein
MNSYKDFLNFLGAFTSYHFKLVCTLLCLSRCGVSALEAEPPCCANITQITKQGFSFYLGRGIQVLFSDKKICFLLIVGKSEIDSV